jgi:6-phospho-3-hexuloisomerase
MSALHAVRHELGAVLAEIAEADVPGFAAAVPAPGTGAVLFTGQGRSGLVAQMAAMRFMHLGHDAHHVGEPTAPPVRPGDALVAVSGSGATAMTVAYARIARDVGASVLLISSAHRSELAALADRVLTVPVVASAQHGGTLFEQAALVVLDSVVLTLMEGAPHAAALMRRNHTNLQ